MLVVLVVGLAALTMGAAGLAEQVHYKAGGGGPNHLLEWAVYPMIWIASLNKALLPAAAAILKEPALDEWTRLVKLASAILAIGYGALAGAYCLLVSFGRAVERSGGIFGWRMLGFVKWGLLAICIAYIAVGIGYLVQWRAFLGDPIFAQVLPTTVGYFLLSLLQYFFLSFIVYFAYVASQNWMRNRQRKKWR